MDIGVNEITSKNDKIEKNLGYLGEIGITFQVAMNLKNNDESSINKVVN